MRIAIPISGNSRKSALSKKFARSPYYALFDTAGMELSLLENPFLHHKTNVGKQIFEMLVGEQKADTFLAFELGLKVQQLAVKDKIQLIILQSLNQDLEDIIRLIQQKRKTEKQT